MSNQAKILAPRRGLSTTMANSTLVLANGEIFIETDATSGIKRIKVGNGETQYKDLNYAFSSDYNDLQNTPGLATSATSGLMPALSTADNVYLKGDGTWGEIAAATTAAGGLMPALSTADNVYLKGDGTWDAPDTYAAMTSAEAISGTGTTAEVISPAVLASAFAGRFVELTQVEYEALDPPDPDVFYFITDADVQNVPTFDYVELTEEEWEHTTPVRDRTYFIHADTTSSV